MVKWSIYRCNRCVRCRGVRFSEKVCVDGIGHVHSWKRNNFSLIKIVFSLGIKRIGQIYEQKKACIIVKNNKNKTNNIQKHKLRH